MKLNSLQLVAKSDFMARLNSGEYRLVKAPCVCGSVRGCRVARYDRYGFPCETKVCRQCGGMWTSHRLAPEHLARFYANDYRGLYGGSEEAGEAFYAKQIEQGRRIYDFVLPFAGSKGVVFDVGCAAGGTLKAFCKEGWTGYGCDYDPRYLERGRRDGLMLREGGIGALRKDAPADLIMLVHVLEHMPDVDASIREARAFLRPGGRIYIELPGIYDMRNEYGALIWYLQNAHLQHYHLALLNHVMARNQLFLEKGNERICALYRYEPERAVTVHPISSVYYHQTKRYLRALNRYSAYVRKKRTFDEFLRRTRGMTRLRNLCWAIPGIKTACHKAHRYFMREAVFESMDQSRCPEEASSVNEESNSHTCT